MRPTFVPLCLLVACADQNPPPPTTGVFDVRWTLRDPATGAALLCEPGETVTLQAGVGTEITTSPCSTGSDPLFLGHVEIVVGLAERSLHVALGEHALDVAISPSPGLNTLYVEIPVPGVGTVGAIAPSWSLYYTSAMAYGGARAGDAMQIGWGAATTTIGQSAWRTDVDLGIPFSNLLVVPAAAIVQGLPVGAAHLTFQLVDGGVATADAQVDTVVVGSRTTIPDRVTLSR